MTTDRKREGGGGKCMSVEWRRAIERSKDQKATFAMDAQNTLPKVGPFVVATKGPPTLGGVFFVCHL